MISDAAEYDMRSNWGIVDLGFVLVLEKLVRELPSFTGDDGEQVVLGPSRQHPPKRPHELVVLGDCEWELYSSTSHV